LRLLGVTPVFALSSASAPEAIERLQQAGERVLRLPHSVIGGADDALATAQAKDALGADTVLLDGYQFRNEMLGRLRASCDRIAYIDDVEQGSFDVDVFINPSLHGDMCRIALPAGARAVGGAKYALIRGSFVVARGEKSQLPAAPHTLSILVSMGGTDPTGKTLDVIEALRGLAQPAEEAISVRVLLSESSPRWQEAQRAATLCGSYLSVEGTVPDLAPLLPRTDLAIVSTSTTLAELSTVGVPAVAMPTVDNQEPVARAAARMQLAVVVDGKVETIRDAVHQLASDPAQRRAMAERQRAAVDGLGAHRVAALLAGREQESA
jgi:spore coat polysaccharide biosynthesis predicted glycosyltransferase SpsG